MKLCRTWLILVAVLGIFSPPGGSPRNYGGEEEYPVGDDPARGARSRRALPPAETASMLRKARQVLRSEGLGSLLVRAAGKCVRSVVRINRFSFFETDLTGPLPNVTARVPLEIRPARPDDFERFASGLEEIGVTRRKVEQGLERGDTAILTLLGPELVHFMWVAFSSVWISEMGVTLRVAPGEAYTHHGVTAPRWRGLGIHGASHCFANWYERSHGCTRHLNYVRSDNFKGLRTMAWLGRRKTKTVWNIWFIGLKRWLVFSSPAAGSPVLITGREISGRG